MNHCVLKHCTVQKLELLEKCAKMISNQLLTGNQFTFNNLGNSKSGRLAKSQKEFNINPPHLGSCITN